MEPDVADAVLSVCGLKATEFKNQIVLSKEKKRKENIESEIGLLDKIHWEHQTFCYKNRKMNI